jgi:acyl-CoA synthetase (AMP-forming)/AMP-acid ligase II
MTTGSASGPTLEQRVRAHAARMPDAAAVVTPTVAISWSQLDRAADSLAGRLRERGVMPGDRVGFLGRNDAHFPILLVAARRARAVLLGLNWRLSRDELDYIVRDARPKLIVADEDFRDLPPPVCEIVSSGRGGAGFAGIGDWFDGDPGRDPTRPEWSDPAMLFYTSGTTGRPKGVLYSLGGLEQMLVAPHPLEFDAASVLLIVPPFFHIAGGIWTQYALLGGLRQVLLPQPTPAVMLDAIERWRVTHAVWVPTLVQMAVEEQQRAPRDLASLHLIGYGAAPMAPALLRSAARVLGCRFAQAYGLTESLGVVCHLPPAAHDAEAPESDEPPATGFPDPGVGLRIVDARSGASLPAGETGEVLVRPPWPHPTYWSLPEGTRSAFDADGWLHTGDLGYVDARGCLHLVDRLSDLIITGGENVYPAEVEAVLLQLPGIAEASVFGQADARWGQRVCAAVVPKPGTALDPAAIIAACRERLAHYKCPVRIVELPSLPRNAAGKVIRRELRQRT